MPPEAIFGNLLTGVLQLREYEHFSAAKEKSSVTPIQGKAGEMRKSRDFAHRLLANYNTDN